MLNVFRKVREILSVGRQNNIDKRAGSLREGFQVTPLQPQGHLFCVTDIPLLFVAEDVCLTVRGPHLEVLGVGFLPAVLNRRYLIGVLVQAEGLRAFVGLVAAVAIDVDGEGHGVILVY